SRPRSRPRLARRRRRPRAGDPDRACAPPARGQHPSARRAPGSRVRRRAHPRRPEHPPWRLAGPAGHAATRRGDRRLLPRPLLRDVTGRRPPAARPRLPGTPDGRRPAGVARGRHAGRHRLTEVARATWGTPSLEHDLQPKGRRRPRALTAPARRNDAAATVADFGSKRALGLWQEASKIRQEWLDHGLSTQPADRQIAEHSLTMIYARISRPRPRFEWVSSPSQALPLVAGWPTLETLYALIRDPRPQGKPPLASDLAMSVSQLRGALSAGVAYADPELCPARRGKSKEPWPELPPQKALATGVPLGVVLHRCVRIALHQSLARGFRALVRTALTGDPGDVPVCWYGQQEASWIAYYDALHRLG